MLVLSVTDNSTNGCPIGVLTMSDGKELLFLTKLPMSKVHRPFNTKWGVKERGSEDPDHCLI
jgi:hypothetical protein